jgi:transposase-like protein
MNCTLFWPDTGASPEELGISETFSKVEVITGVARRRRFTTEQKLSVVNEMLQPGMSISYVAHRHGLSLSLVFRWRRLMSEGGKEAVRVDEDVTASINDAAQLARREWCTERQVNLTLSLAFLALNSSRQRSKDVSINIEPLCDPDPELGPRSFESSVSFRAKHVPTRAQSK